eukprot:symbB.v1.2.001616.t1/scaffold80.1/size342472/3
MARERELPPQKRFSLSGRRLSSISVTKGPIARPLTCQDVPWNTLMEQITKANGTRGSNYVAKALPGWKYDGLRDPEDWHGRVASVDCFTQPASPPGHVGRLGGIATSQE